MFRRENALLNVCSENAFFATTMLLFSADAFGRGTPERPELLGRKRNTENERGNEGMHFLLAKMLHLASSPGCEPTPFQPLPGGQRRGRPAPRGPRSRPSRAGAEPAPSSGSRLEGVRPYPRPRSEFCDRSLTSILKNKYNLQNLSREADSAC